MADKSGTSQVATAGRLTLNAGQMGGAEGLLGGTVVVRGDGRDETLTGERGENDYILIGNGGLDHLYAGSNVGPVPTSTTFLINRASDLVVGEVYQGVQFQDSFGNEHTSITGKDIKADVGLVGITVTDVQIITGFSGTLTMTAGQLAGFDVVHAGAIRLAGGGTVHLADFVGAGDLYLSDTATALAFTAADVLHLQGYGTYTTYHTGVVAGFTVHGGTGNDTITAQAAGEVFNARITQLGVTLLGGGGDDSLTGGDGRDVIGGGLGDDGLFGGKGKDRLFAAEGDDTLTGGAGADLFVIGVQAGGSDDAITDFSGLGTTVAGDRIKIAGGATAADYLGADGFTASGVTEVRFAHGMLKIDFDGDGTADSSFFLTGMTLATQLTQDDFL